MALFFQTREPGLGTLLCVMASLTLLGGCASSAGRADNPVLYPNAASMAAAEDSLVQASTCTPSAFR